MQSSRRSLEVFQVSVIMIRDGATLRMYMHVRTVVAGLDRYLLINSSRLVTASAISSIIAFFSTHPWHVELSCFTASSNAGVCRSSQSADSLIEANDGSRVA